MFVFFFENPTTKQVDNCKKDDLIVLKENLKSLALSKMVELGFNSVAGAK